VYGSAILVIGTWGFQDYVLTKVWFSITLDIMKQISTILKLAVYARDCNSLSMNRSAYAALVEEASDMSTDGIEVIENVCTPFGDFKLQSADWLPDHCIILAGSENMAVLNTLTGDVTTFEFKG